MARGRFGRLPRAAADISGAIIAAVREYQAQRERNIVDAWKNGGKFEGHKVTDSMLIRFFNAKLEGMDPEDPEYDNAKNTANQYKFAVRNSKQELLYAQKKVSDGGMAAFYRREAALHPKDSEMWRQLMTLSAQYQDRANVGSGGGGGGGGRGGGRRRSSVAERNARIETPRSSELAWSVMSDILLDLARRRGIVNSGESLETATETTGEGFGDLQVWQGDFNAMQDLLDEFANSPQYEGERQALTEYIKKWGDPNFDGDFSLAGVGAMRTAAMNGIKHRLKDAQRNGTKTQVKALTKALKVATKAGSALSLVDPMAEYEEARAAWEQITGDPKASPLEKWNATIEYRNEIAPLWAQMDAEAAALGGSDGGWMSTHAGRLLAEWQALGGDDSNVGPTLWEETRGNVVGLPGSKENSDAWTTAQEVKRMQRDLELLTDGTGDWVIARVDSDGNPTTGVDYELGVVAKSTVEASGIPVAYIGAGTPSIDYPNPDGSSSKVDMSTALEVVYGKTIVTQPTGQLERFADGTTGRPTTADFTPMQGTRTDIGAVFDYEDGSRVYRIFDSNGVARFTFVPPWAKNPDGSQMVTESYNPAKNEVTLSWTINRGPRSQYNPADAIDQVYRDPQQVNAMQNSVFKSAFLAHAVAYKNNLGGSLWGRGTVQATDAETQAALYAESGGDMNVFNTLYTEVSEYTKRQTQMVQAQNAFNDAMAAGVKELQPLALMGMLGASFVPEGAVGDLGNSAEATKFYNNRAMMLLTGGDPNMVPGSERVTPERAGKNLANYIKELTAASSKALTQPGYWKDGVFHPVGQGYQAPPPGTAMGVVGLRDDGRPIYEPVVPPTLQTNVGPVQGPPAPKPPVSKPAAPKAPLPKPPAPKPPSYTPKPSPTQTGRPLYEPDEPPPPPKVSYQPPPPSTKYGPQPI